MFNEYLFISPEISRRFMSKNGGHWIDNDSKDELLMVIFSNPSSPNFLMNLQQETHLQNRSSSSTVTFLKLKDTSFEVGGVENEGAV